jgi:DNA mismatch repair protein MutL
VEKNMDQAIDVKLFEEISSFSFQYKGRYIITSLKSGLAIIDQHHAHVRILFDQYVNNVKRQQGASQQLLFPEVIELSPVEISILPSLLEDLHFVGFDLSNLGQGSYAINGLPVGVEHLDPVSLVRDVIQQAIENETKATEDICCSIALSLANPAAIRPGKILTVDEMEHLQASLFSSTDSYLTPDGKIILTLLTDDELEKRFSR